MNTHFWFAAILAALAVVITIQSIQGVTMAKQADVDALTAQVVKIGSEVQNVKTELAKVQAQVDALGVPVDLSALTAAIQSVDDLNPDAQPAGDPVTDPVVEERAYSELVHQTEPVADDVPF